MHSLDSLMQDVLNAYYEGKGKKESSYPEEHAKIPKREDGFLPQEQTIKGAYSGLTVATIRAIQQGELASAQSLIQRINDLIETDQLSQDSFSFCKSHLEALVAYLEYKHERFNQAIAHLQVALAIDQHLEERNPAFAYLHLHRIMLLNNWVRVLGSSEHHKDAISLAFQILDYLEQKTSLIDAITSWDSAKLIAYPSEELTRLFRGTTSEIAEVVTGVDSRDTTKKDLNVREIFSYICHHTQCIKANNCYLSPASHDWMCMKQALLEEDLSTFLRWAAHILLAGPGTWPTFWYATIVECIIFSRNSPTRAGELFQRAVIEDVTLWQLLPAKWNFMITGL